MINKLLFACLFLVCFFGITRSAYAEKINSLDVSVTVHKNGLFNISETINYDFENLSRHGIYRYIPLYSKVGDLYRIIKIDNVSIERDGQKEKFEKSTNKEKVYFKIGNASKTITGAHIYKISYTVENGIGSNFPDHDEIYWNATGNDWQVGIEKASINFATNFGLKPKNLICFEGAIGAKDKTCTVKDSTVTSSQILYPGYGLTAVAVYPKGTFPPSVLNKELPKTYGEIIGGLILANIGLIWILLNLVLPLVILIWYQKKKNKKRFGPPVVNFDIPKDEKGERLAPALAGTIDTAALQRDDVVATLFDLAIRKYIRLEEIKNKKSLLPDKVTQKIIKLKDPSAGSGQELNDFEKELFDRLFEAGNEVSAEDLKKDFYKTYAKMEVSVFASLVDKRYFVKNPKVQRGFLLVFGMMALFTLNILLGISLLFLSKKLIGRTALGDEIDFKIDGLKLFLKSMDRDYKWQAEKFYTVEQMIPYAMALGYIDKFMEQLKIIKPDYNPTWYHGYAGGFYVSYGSFFSGVNSSMTTSAPSSSSG
ncbi:MAG: hypothetical protein ACD_12C00321G0001, partial [uncultured bacterium]